jgi:hypothetical protein
MLGGLVAGLELPIALHEIGEHGFEAGQLVAVRAPGLFDDLVEVRDRRAESTLLGPKPIDLSPEPIDLATESRRRARLLAGLPQLASEPGDLGASGVELGVPWLRPFGSKLPALRQVLRSRDEEGLPAPHADDVLAEVATSNLQRGLTARAAHDDPIPRERRGGGVLDGSRGARPVPLLAQERPLALLAEDRLAEVNPPNSQTGRTVRAIGDEMRLSIIHANHPPLRQGRPGPNHVVDCESRVKIWLEFQS